MSSGNDTPANQNGTKAPNVANVTLLLLFFCYVVNLLDRSIISFLAVPIKADLGLSDAEFGIITGPAFSITYGLFSFLFAYYADRHNRVNLLTGLLAFWSVATLACSFAGSFLQLFLMRLLVGVGGAGGTPTAMALEPDCVPKERLSSAYSFILLAGPSGMLLASVGGSYVAAHYGWRPTFLLCGVLGLFLAVVIKLKMSDPRTTKVASVGTETPLRSIGNIVISVIDAFRVMITRRSLILILLSFSCSQWVSMVLPNWGAIFLNRSHGLSVNEIAFYFGVALVGGLAPGLVVGGLLTDRLARKNPLWRIYVPIFALLGSTPLFLAAFYLSDWRIALCVLALGSFIWALNTAPTVAAFNAAIPSQIRAIGTASLLLAASVVSGGVGNFLIGLMSDRLADTFGTGSLQIVLLGAILCFGVISILFLLLAARRHAEDLKSSDQTLPSR